MVTPQFEAGRREAPKGVVRDPAVQARVVEEVVAAAATIGLAHAGTTRSPITGSKGATWSS